MKHLRFLALATLVALPLACSDEKKDTVAPITGTISGAVTVEGTGLAGVSIALVGATSGSATTAAGGTYSFTGVEAGSYALAIIGSPADDVIFATTTKNITITTAGQVVTVDFAGSYIRTANISGNVVAGGEGLAGVAVTMTGPEGAKNAVTDGAGHYSASGLRKGDYTVAITPPEGYTFANSSFDVSVGVGEAKEVSFFGEPTETVDPVTASVVITSVTNALTGATINPNDVAGQINVNLTIDPGENDLQGVCVLLNGAEVANGCQTLGSAAPEEMLQAGVLPVTFTIFTNAFDEDGTPIYGNASYVLSARLDLENAQESNVTTTMNLKFNNTDALYAMLDPQFMKVVDGDYQLGGTMDVTITPVMFSGKVLDEIDVAMPWKTFTVEGPFPKTQTITYSRKDFGYDTQYYNDVPVEDGVFTDGTFWSKTTVAVMDGDDRAPTAADYGHYYFDYKRPTWAAGALTLTDQLKVGTSGEAEKACCANNWVGPDYAPKAGLTAKPSDNAGVGVQKTEFMVIDVAAKDTVLIAETATMADVGFAQSLTNQDYKLCAVATDYFGNWGTVCKTTNGSNTNDLFGYDDTAPTSQKVTAPPNQYTFNILNNTDQGGLTVSASEDRSGFSALPFRSYMQWWDADDMAYIVAQDDEDGGMVNLAGTIQSCIAVGGGTPAAGGTICYPDFTSADGVYYVTGSVNNQAGMDSGDAFEGWVYNDQTAPTAGNVSLPGTVKIGQSMTVSAPVSDNLHVGATGFSFQPAGFPDWIPLGALVPNSAGDMDKWDGNFPTSDQASLTINPAIVGWQRYADLVTFKIDKARATHYDLAGNASTGIGNNFDPNTVDNPKSYAADGITGYAVTEPAAAVSLCNGQGADACDTDVPPGHKTSVTAKVVASGAAGSFANPFLTGKVYYYLYHNSQYYLLGSVDAASAVVNDAPAGRTYTWSFTITKDHVARFPDGTNVSIWAVGVKNSYGTGLFTALNGNLNVVDGK